MIEASKRAQGNEMGSYFSKTHSAISELRSVLRQSRSMPGLSNRKDGTLVVVFEDGRVGHSPDGITWSITPPGLWKPDASRILHRAGEIS